MSDRRRNRLLPVLFEALAGRERDPAIGGPGDALPEKDRFESTLERSLRKGHLYRQRGPLVGGVDAHLDLRVRRCLAERAVECLKVIL